MFEAAHKMDAAVRARVRRRLLAWYDREKRDLPWRRRSEDAYAQMLAEVMLQQTQVATVIGYYERFITRFPTVADLARADLDTVLALWSGLGYYSRARNLYAAARAVMAEHAGVFPSEVAGLMSLPGIGRYTAGAIASIAFGRRAPILDGNVARVLARLTALTEDPKQPAVREWLWTSAELLLPPGPKKPAARAPTRGPMPAPSMSSRCGDFNQALMELGAMVCKPRSPACVDCPIAADCRARQLGLTEEIPVTGRRTRVQAGEFVVAAVRRNGRLLFRQRPMDGLWAGLWELPSEPLAAAEPHAAGLRRLERQLGAACRIADEPIGSTTRQLTHRRFTFHLYRGKLTASGERLNHGQAYRWLNSAELERVGISRAALAVLELLQQEKGGSKLPQS